MIGFRNRKRATDCASALPAKFERCARVIAETTRSSTIPVSRHRGDDYAKRPGSARPFCNSKARRSVHLLENEKRRLHVVAAVAGVVLVVDAGLEIQVLTEVVGIDGVGVDGQIGRASCRERVCQYV